MTLINTETAKSYIKPFNWIKESIDNIPYYVHEIQLYSTFFQVYVEVNDNDKWFYYVEAPNTSTYSRGIGVEFDSAEEAKDAAFDNFVNEITKYLI